MEHQSCFQLCFCVLEHSHEQNVLEAMEGRRMGDPWDAASWDRPWAGPRCHVNPECCRPPTWDCREVVPGLLRQPQSRSEGWTQGWCGARRLQQAAQGHHRDSPAHSTDEAVGVVSLAQRRHHLAFDELVAAEAAGSIEALVIKSADVLSLAHEEAALSQVAAACWERTAGESQT